MEKEVRFKRQLSSRGDSDGVNLPKELLEFINAKVGDEITLTAQSGKHGNFIAMFKEKR